MSEHLGAAGSDSSRRPSSMAAAVVSLGVFGLAQKYYPRLWDRERLEALLAAGWLSQEEFDSLVTSTE